ncbi:MAG: ATP-binding protein, partial [Hydrogenophaga sp.]
QPFATDPQRRGGTGLGLAICHGIVQSLGGRIALTNRERLGRTEGLDATVRLPRAG